MTRHQREVFVAAFNSAHEAKMAETQDNQAAESYAFAVATAAAKKAPKSAPKEKSAMKELKFTATVPFLKAWEEDGKRFISMLASSDTTDKSAERVVPEFIAKMREDATGGKIALLENHSDVIPIARSAGILEGADVWDAAVAKGCKASGPESIFVPKFELDEEHPLADKVYKAVGSADCDWQCSIGGKAVAKKVFDKETATIVQELWPGSIDHIALTRNGAACNPDTMMFGAVMKSEEWAEVENPETEPLPDKPEAVVDALEGEQTEKAEEPQATIGISDVVDDTPDLLQAAIVLSSTVDAVITKLQSERMTDEQVREIIRDELAKGNAATAEAAESAPVMPQGESEPPAAAETLSETTDAATATEGAGAGVVAATSEEVQALEPPKPALSPMESVAALFADMGAKLSALLGAPPEPATAKDAPETEDTVEKASEAEPKTEVDILKAKVAALSTEIETLKKSPDPAANLPVLGTELHEVDRKIGDGSAEVTDNPVAKAIAAARAAKGTGNRAEFDAKQAAQKAIANLIRDL
jgi:cation transport regulator ChaB